jgi:hypothetical protein
MSDTDSQDLPQDMTFPLTLQHHEYLGTDEYGVSSYNGTYLVCGSTHPVLIKRKQNYQHDNYSPSDEIQAIIDVESSFAGHLFSRQIDDEIVTVRDREECSLRGLVDYPNGLGRLPAWVAVKKCMKLVRDLHRHRYCHNSLNAGRFAIVDTDNALEVRLSGFHRADPFPDSAEETRIAVNADLLRLGNALSEFLGLIRLHQPDRVDERFNLLDDLIRRIIHTSLQKQGNLTLLLTHPAIQPYDRSMALACAVSDAMITNAAEVTIGRELLLALDAISGNDFDLWPNRFLPETPGIHLDYRVNVPRPLVWNELDRLESLQCAVRVFRNRSAHRVPALAVTLGETPTSFTQTWVRCLPKMWLSLWLVVMSQRFRPHFHGFFRESE